MKLWVQTLLCMGLLMGDASFGQTSSNKPAAKKPAAQTAKKETKKKAKDWPLLQCGQDLKSLEKNIDTYQKKLIPAAKKLPKEQRIKLYTGTSVFAESLTLMAPEVFWDDLLVSRVTKPCYETFKSLRKSLSTNDSVGSPKKLKDWNKCVAVIYGALPRQTRQINKCIHRGVKYIKSKQKASKR